MPLKKHLYVFIGIVFWLTALAFTLLPSWPNLYYRLSPQTSNTLAATIASTATEAQAVLLEPTPTATPIKEPTTKNLELPNVDPSLPKENGLIIEKIGVRGEIHEGKDWPRLLRLGIWRVPNFATPSDICNLTSENCRPTILAAHRWGYLDWTASFRKLNSFINLPQLKQGDKVRIIWDQRPFEYEVYTTETGTKITDYTADLILYTCQLWSSPIRFFVYAKRIN